MIREYVKRVGVLLGGLALLRVHAAERHQENLPETIRHLRGEKKTI